MGPPWPIVKEVKCYVFQTPISQPYQSTLDLPDRGVGAFSFSLLGLVPIDRRPDVDRANARGGEAIDGGSRGETETSERREKRVVESTRGGDAR